jgi:periplasmic divalent cation tolerance protein
MTDEVCEVIITAPDPEWLAEFTRSLVNDSLAASGHNIALVRSIYRWQGQIYDKSEARVALHTRRSLVSRIVERTNREHPYEVPCVAAITFDGDPAYVKWVLEETAAA